MEWNRLWTNTMTPNICSVLPFPGCPPQQQLIDSQVVCWLIDIRLRNRRWGRCAQHKRTRIREGRRRAICQSPSAAAAVLSRPSGTLEVCFRVDDASPELSKQLLFISWRGPSPQSPLCVLPLLYSVSPVFNQELMLLKLCMVKIHSVSPSGSRC